MLLGCISEKSTVYFNERSDSTRVVSKPPIPVILPGDILSLQIVAADQSSLSPFLTPPQSATGAKANQGPTSEYLVSEDSTILIPIIGRVKLGGYNTIEASILLENQLRKYVHFPKVMVRIINFKVSVLGEVKNPGIYSIPEGRVTILQLIAMAGDLTIYGKRVDITVVRTINGVKKYYEVNLTNDDFYDSDVYYLRQNDLVYVRPNKAQLSKASYTPLITVIVSLTTLVITLLNILIR